MDIKVLPPRSEEERWADPYWVEDTIEVISDDADTFEHLARYGLDAYPDGLQDVRESWFRSMAEDLPRLERVGREGELERMDWAISSRLDPSLASRREPLPDLYEGLKHKLAGLVPIMREHGFLEPPAELLR